MTYTPIYSGIAALTYLFRMFNGNSPAEIEVFVIIKIGLVLPDFEKVGVDKPSLSSDFSRHLMGRKVVIIVNYALAVEHNASVVAEDIAECRGKLQKIGGSGRGLVQRKSHKFEPHFTVPDAVGIDGLRLIGEHSHPYFAMARGGTALGIGHFKDAAPGRKDIGICYGLAIIGIDHTELGRNRGQVQEKSTAQKEKRSNTIHRKVCNKLIRQLNSPGFNEGPSILQTGRERFLFKPWREIQG